MDGLDDLPTRVLHESALDISRILRLGARAAERQALAHGGATRVQRASALLVVNRYAARQSDPLIRGAGLCIAMELGHDLVGARPAPHFLRALTELGAEVVAGEFAPVAGAERAAAAMPDQLSAPAQAIASALAAGR